MLKKRKAPPYYQAIATTKKYQILLTQTGTNPPAITEINNELGLVTWTRFAAGRYRITWTEFNNTINTIFLQGSAADVITSAIDTDTGYLEVRTQHPVGGDVDDKLDGAYCEITAQQIYSE